MHLLHRYSFDLKVVLNKLYAIFHIVKLYRIRLTICTLPFGMISNFEQWDRP